MAVEIPAEVGAEAMETGVAETGAIGDFEAVDFEAVIAFWGDPPLPLVSAFPFMASIPDTDTIHTAGIIRTVGTIPTAGTTVLVTIPTINRANIILMVLCMQDALLGPPMPAS